MTRAGTPTDHRHRGGPPGWFRPVAKISIAIALLAAFGLAVMLLWNALMPGITGAGSVTYLEAVGILLLCRLLFGGGGIAAAMATRTARRSLSERWASLHPDDRAAFLERRGGPHPGHRGADRRCRCDHNEPAPDHPDRAPNHARATADPEITPADRKDRA